MSSHWHPTPRRYSGHVSLKTWELLNEVDKIPTNITFDEAATIPTVLTAAYVGLYNQVPHGLGFDSPVSKDARGKYAGIPIVITGGTSSVGQKGA